MINTESIVNLLGIASFIAAFSLGIVLVFKLEEIRKLKVYLEKLKKSFDELDEQAKLIVRTDLELNKIQEELDKKVSGLYTLQRVSRAISTTLDEEQIFKRIDEFLVAELGFEKALLFTIQKEEDGLLTLSLKIQSGYNHEEVDKIIARLQEEHVLSAILKNNSPFSSLPIKEEDSLRNIGTTLERLIKAIKDICAVNSFVASLIPTKDKPYGLIIMGNESALSVITEGDEEIVAILATQLGQAIENAKLFEQTFRSQQELERRVSERTKELTAALQEIKQINKRKSEFVSAVSHELRTPLTSIKGYASILSAGQLGKLPDAAKERIEKINRHSNELTELINNLLDISRIESGKVEMQIIPQDIVKIVEKISDLFAPQIKEKEIQFTQNIPKDLEKILADARQIERVFINLVSNALKYTPPQGKIGISMEKMPDNYLKIDISDSGCGIPARDLTSIFNEFYRVDSLRNRDIKGTGLGLSLVKYIVEAHKGKIWVTSKENFGSTFSFTLPFSSPTNNE